MAKANPNKPPRLATAEEVATGPGRSRRLPIALGIVALVGVVALIATADLWVDPEALARRAQGEYMEGRYAESEVDLNRSLRRRPPTPADWMLKAQFSMIRKEDDRALDELAKVPDDHPMGGQARMQAGQLELRRNRYVPAERYFVRALEIDPKLVKARRELVFIYGMQLRRKELSATFRALAETSSLTFSEVFLWCLSRGVTWEANEIVATLQKCLDADPTDRWARLGMAEGLRELGRFDEAEQALAPLPESDPQATASRVRISIDRGQDQEGESLLARAPADNLEIALLRGRYALARDDGAEAVRQFRIAYQLDPRLRESILGLGQALQSTGDNKAAAPLLAEALKHDRLGTLIQKAAIEKNRDDPKLVFDLAAACAEIGRYPEARAWYNIAITRDPADPDAQEGLRKVKEAEAAAKGPGEK